MTAITAHLVIFLHVRPFIKSIEDIPSRDIRTQLIYVNTMPPGHSVLRTEQK